MTKCDHTDKHPDCPWCGSAEDVPRPGDLRFEGMGADSKMFAFLKPWGHADGSWYEVKLSEPADAHMAKLATSAQSGGGWPTCSECGYTGYMVTKLMGHQATAYMCPKDGCGHLTPIMNKGHTGGHSGPPMGWITGPARVLPVPAADFSIDKDGEIEPLSERAKEVWKQERVGTWTNLDEDGVATGEAIGIRFTPNEWKFGLSAESDRDEEEQHGEH